MTVRCDLLQLRPAPGSLGQTVRGGVGGRYLAMLPNRLRTQPCKLVKLELCLKVLYLE